MYHRAPTGVTAILLPAHRYDLCRAGRSSLDDAGAAHGANIDARKSASETVLCACCGLDNDISRDLSLFTCVCAVSPPPPSSLHQQPHSLTRELLQIAPSATFLIFTPPLLLSTIVTKLALDLLGLYPEQSPRHAHQRVSPATSTSPVVAASPSILTRIFGLSPNISSLPSLRVLCPATTRFFR